MQPIIEFEHFGFQYDAQAEPTLTDINLKIYPGERVLIAGPSGSGKSTLASCVNGLIPFSYSGSCSGRLTVAGVDAPHSSIFELSKHVGTVLQDTDGQFIGLTVGEDIAFALENQCMPQDQMHKTVERVAKLVSVEDLLSHEPHALSGGQKQRVSLAGVMVDDVQVLVFDEPLANLDPATGKQAIELIDQVQKETGAAVLIIEHRLEDVLWRSVDRIILMDEGRILADQTPAQLLCGPLLAKAGIREPLYLTAAKYAGLTLKPEMRPDHQDTFTLSNEEKAQVRRWFSEPLPQNKAPAGQALLEVRELTFGYDPGKTNLENISFTLNKGEMVSIVGRNGAGKSTLSKLICGFETPRFGSILLEGRDLAGDTIKERAVSIGYVMQNPNQMISQSMIFDEVALGLRTRRLPEEEVTRRVHEALKICGLYPFRSWPVSALSFGQKKRVTIASVLVMQPQILILDEPTAGQDFRHYTDIMEFLRQLNQQGYTVIMVTHDMHLMLEYTPRALVFSEGHLIADLAPARLLCNEQLVKQAALKETSLYSLATQCGIENADSFVQHFIDYDREVRG